MNKLTVLACLMLLSLAGCKKYNEGPTISFWPRRERIEGKWIANRVFKDQAEITGSYKKYIWEFTRQYSVITTIDTLKINGIWSTMSREKDFVIDYDNGTREIYEIRKMKRDEFWIRDRQTQTEIQLKPF